MSDSDKNQKTESTKTSTSSASPSSSENQTSTSSSANTPGSNASDTAYTSTDTGEQTEPEAKTSTTQADDAGVDGQILYGNASVDPKRAGEYAAGKVYPLYPEDEDDADSQNDSTADTTNERDRVAEHRDADQRKTDKA